MAHWRKNKGISNHQWSLWRSSSSNGKPPLYNRFPTMSSWEKKFCASVCSVPWRKIIEGKKYMVLHSNVMNWDDSAVKEAIHDAKFRFWGQINGFRCSIPLPDPNMYIDDVDWDASVDPELCMDLDREIEARRNIEERVQETLIVDNSLLLKEYFDIGWVIEPTGWGDDDDEVTKPPESSDVAENNETNSWEENESQRWIPKEYYGGDLQHKYQARNWGAWEGHSRMRENNMLWSKNPTNHHGSNGYQMNRGRRNGARGGGGGARKENYCFAAKVAATPNAWKNSLNGSFEA